MFSNFFLFFLIPPECIDLPVVTQAKSLDDLVINIKEVLLLHLEEEDFTGIDLDKNYMTRVN